jgi:hypothetical protein
MTQIITAGAIVAVALVVAALVQRRRVPDAPAQPTWEVPAQLDRHEFAHPDAPWLVAVFSSATCNTCAKVVAQARVMESSTVAFDNVEYGQRAETHRRYHIEAVPIVVVADAEGVVRASFVGPHTATDLWAALAEVRDPGSVPQHPDRHCQ